MSEYTDDEEFHLDENDGEDQSKYSPPPPEISSYRKHSMDYFTRDGVILRTGFSNLVTQEILMAKISLALMLLLLLEQLWELYGSWLLISNRIGQ